MHDMTPHNLTKNALSDASHSVFEIVHKSLICLVKNVNSLYFTNYQEPQQICILKFWHRDKRQRTSPDTAMFVSFMYFLSFFFFWKYMQFIKSYRASPTCHASKLKYPTGFFRWQQGCVDHFVDTADPLPPPPPPPPPSNPMFSDCADFQNQAANFQTSPCRKYSIAFNKTEKRDCRIAFWECSLVDE